MLGQLCVHVSRRFQNKAALCWLSTYGCVLDLFIQNSGGIKVVSE